jgi:dipeptide/tripeptide permease
METPWRVFDWWFRPPKGHEPQSIVWAVLLPQGQTDTTRQERTAVIRSRCRVIALLFAVLTPAWIAIDVLTFEAAQWKALAVGRVVAALLFALIARLTVVQSGDRAALVAVLSLFAVPIVFFFIRRASSRMSAWRGPASPRPRPIFTCPSSSPRGLVFSR